MLASIFGNAQPAKRCSNQSLGIVACFVPTETFHVRLGKLVQWVTIAVFLSSLTVLSRNRQRSIAPH